MFQYIDVFFLRRRKKFRLGQVFPFKGSEDKGRDASVKFFVTLIRREGIVLIRFKMAKSLKIKQGFQWNERKKIFCSTT
jgi:hypothetical protein